MNDLRDALRTLGIPEDALEPLENRVYSAMVRVAKASKRPVMPSELRIDGHPRPTEATLYKAIKTLVRGGRVAKVGWGRYIPIVKGSKR